MPAITEPHGRMEGDTLTASAQRQRASAAQDSDAKYVNMTREAYKESTMYIDDNVRSDWERGLANFQNRHPSGSKYFTDQYRHRSKLFRPKIRTMVRQNEAAAAAAFFSTADVVSIDAEDDSSMEQVAAAGLIKELCNYRLNNHLPWFQVCVGALQDTLNHGICISHQEWRYQERGKSQRVTFVDPVTGEETHETVQSVEVVEDRPNIRLVPPENFRFSPAADWVDPANTSPYLLEMIPMYVQDVKERMGKASPKAGEPKWREIPTAALQSGRDLYLSDSVRRAREGGRSDSKEDFRNAVRDYQTIWIIRNIFRIDGRDWMWYTIGTEVMLSDPVPVESVYLHCDDGKRPYVIGYSVLETHKPYPCGLVALLKDLQAATNEISNQRIDNVRLAMNKQYFVKEGNNVDIKTLLRNVPGSVVRMQNPQSDVQVVQTPDVTGSSYNEQDRINVDFDDLAGQFSQGTVQSNRALNETVGGMNLLAGTAGQVTEYLLRLFTETWVEPVLRQLVKMERYYETDDTVMAIAGRKANLEYVDYGFFQHNLAVSVNVGMGSTNPTQKVERFILATNSVAGIAPQLLQQINPKEIVKEIFGQLGYQDGSRFFMGLDAMADQGQPEPPPDPRAMAEQAKQQVAMMQAQAKQEEAQGKLRMQQQELTLKAQGLQTETQNDLAELDFKREQSDQEIALKRQQHAAEIALKREIEMAKLALEQDLTMAELETRLQIHHAKAQQDDRHINPYR